MTCRQQRWARAAAGTLILSTLLGLGAWRWRLGGGDATTGGSAQESRLLDQSEQALRQGDVADALELARQALHQSPRSARGLRLAGEAAGRMGDVPLALGFLEQVPDDGSFDAAYGRLLAGELYRMLGRADAAERSYRDALSIHPDLLQARSILAYLLQIEGRHWEARRHFGELLQAGGGGVDELIEIGRVPTPVDPNEELVHMQAASPGDIGPLLGLAAVAMNRNELEEAHDLLQRVVAADPSLAEAQARLGEVLLGQALDAQWQRWQASLPPEVEEHPGIWFVRGMRARQADDLPGAVRCFWECLWRDPNHLPATYQIAPILRSLGESELAAVFEQRARDLHELDEAVLTLYTERRHTHSLRRAAERCESLGRFWEARGWYEAIGAIEPAATWARDAQRRLPTADPARRGTIPLDTFRCPSLDAAAFPLPPQGRLVAATGPDAAGPLGEVRVRFEDQAPECGIAFVYQNGHDEALGGARMFETTGGGVGVIDYDGDRWPDLYFSQGCRWPPDEAQREFLDRLYRNLDGRRASDVTQAAGLGDERFGQGVAAGDYDNDGFADLYVANIGGNRLYRNNGDGTFTDVAPALGLVSHHWTTSALVADVNGDAHPDLYEVNYLEGDDVYERLCAQDQGQPRTCPPVAFSAQQDVLWLGAGDGRFVDVSSESGILVDRGNGLGIVAADLDGSGRLSLFVANDGTPNFLFLNETDAPGDSPRFREAGWSSGVALDGDGHVQACMGVAAGDANGDGFLDLLVTNFLHESSTLYLRLGPSVLFEDATAAAGLRDPSFEMLGFGTQFLDGELDGWPDPLVTNGHVDDFTDVGQPYHMRPQYFRNLGDGRFQELRADTLGPFFAGEYLGRGLARLDWDRDGREDAAISHMKAAAALLLNRTQGAGHFLALQLRGVTRDRDAIGTTVTVRAGERTWVRQLTAGDGYQASNQRQLVFGLGPHERVDELSVRWTSGQEQTFHDLLADRQWLLVEGRAELHELLR